MKYTLANYYLGAKGHQRQRAMQRFLSAKVLPGRSGEKVLLWSALPGLDGGGAMHCPFTDNQRPPYGNGAFDRLVIIHCFDVASEAPRLMAEAARLVRDHGVIDVIGWTKPKYEHDLPLLARGRRRVALRMTDRWSMRWRRYEKVQNLLTLNFDARTGQTTEKAAPATPMPIARNASSDK